MKKILTFVLVISALAALLVMSTAALNIETADEFIAFAQDSSKWKEDIALMADIDLSDRVVQPIGTVEKPFTGTFSGNGHTLKLNIASMNAFTGLFGVAKGAYIHDLTIEGSVMSGYLAKNAETKSGDNYVTTGAFVGIALNGVRLENCTNRATVTAPCNVGGVVGMIAPDGTATVYLENCDNYGTVNSTYGNAGGVVGRVRTAHEAGLALHMVKCDNFADLVFVSEDRPRLGGVIGYIRANKGYCKIENCRNEGNLNADNDSKESTHYCSVGGICGRAEVHTDISAGIDFINCYNSGSMVSSRYVGGIVGYYSHSEKAIDHVSPFTNCVNIGTVVSTGSYAGGIAGYTTASTPITMENCLNAGPVDGVSGAGGMLGRQGGMNVKNCISLSRAFSETGMGGVIGVAGGSTVCLTDGVYYPNINRNSTGTIAEACADTGSHAFDVTKANDQLTFGSMDFSGWVMGDKCPVPKTMKDEKIVITEGDLSALEEMKDGPKDGSPIVVYHDRNGSNDNDGLTPKTPKATLGTMSTHIYRMLQNGGVIVCVGDGIVTSNYTFAKTYGPITYTSVWDGVDYRNAQPADRPACCFGVKSGLSLTVCSDITFDNIILFQLGKQNTIYVQNGGNLVVTDTVQLLSASGLDYHYQIVVQKGGTAILSKEAMKKFTVVNEGGTVVEYTSGTEIRLTIGSKTGYVNGEAKALAAAPINRGGNTMLPVRFVAENLGGTVGWDGATSSITIKGDGVDISMKVGAKTASINGKTVTLNIAPFIEGGSTYLPVRVVAEAMGAQVAWDGATSTAILTK